MEGMYPPSKFTVDILITNSTVETEYVDLS